MRRGVHELCPLLKRRRACTASPTGTASASTRTPCSRAICAQLRSARRRAGHRRARRRDRARRRRLDGRRPSAGERYSAPILVNAAGAWADQSRRWPASGRSARARNAGRSSPSTRRPAPISIGCRSPRRSATSSISRRRAGGCSPRRWTRCRAIRAMRSPTNMRSRSRPFGWRSGRSSRSSASTAAGPACAPSRPTAIRRSALPTTRKASSGSPGRAGSGCRPRRRWRRSSPR